MQRILVSDLPDRLTTAAMIAAGGSWLAGRALLTGLAGELRELDWFAGALIGTVPALALLGPRSIVVDERGISVTRRGRLVRTRRMDEIAGIRGRAPLLRLSFTDGSSMLWFTTGQGWGPATEFIVERIGRATLPGAMSLVTNKICFPPGCVGCGAPAEVEVAITGRRGTDLVLGSFAVSRSVMAPACRNCRAERRGLGALFSFGPLVGLTISMFIPLLTPLKGTPLLVIAGLLVLAFFVLRYRGDVWADWYIWGMHGELTADGTVHLRYRDPEQQAAIAAASAAAGADARPTSAARPEV